jgi:hypothetical protein
MRETLVPERTGSDLRSVTDLIEILIASRLGVRGTGAPS